MTFITKPRALDFARQAIAHALAKGNSIQAQDYAANRWPGSMVARAFATKAAAGSLGGVTWGDEFKGLESANAEFLQLVTQATVLGRMAGTKPVPSLIRLLQIVDGSTASWIGEGKATPMKMLSLTAQIMRLKKVLALTATTEDMMRDGGLKGEQAIASDLVRASAQAIDEAFLDPANAGDDIMPAAVTYGAEDVPYTGTWATDLRKAIQAFAGDLTNAFWVARPAVFARLSGAAYPNIGARGGDLLGIPALPSNWFPGSADSPDTDFLALIDASGIAVADEGIAEIKTSHAATIQMLDSPTIDTVTPTAATLVSMWQTGSVAIMAARSINWKMERAGGAVIISGIPRT